jgi:hypothetical protein
MGFNSGLKGLMHVDEYVLVIATSCMRSDVREYVQENSSRLNKVISSHVDLLKVEWVVLI